MSKSPEESSWVSGKTKEVQQTTLSSYFSQQHNRKRRKVTTNAPVVTPVKEQLYLDFGQADFGERRTCPHCGMMTVQGLEEDVQAHALVCDDYRRGILWRSTQYVVWKNEDGARIVKASGRNDWSALVLTLHFRFDHTMPKSIKPNWKICKLSLMPTCPLLPTAIQSSRAICTFNNTAFWDSSPPKTFNKLC